MATTAFLEEFYRAREGLSRVFASADPVNKLETNTTIGAVVCRDSVVIGCERRVTMSIGGGMKIASDEFDKLFDIDRYTVFAFSGSVGHGLAIRRQFRSLIRRWKTLFRPIEAKGKVNILSRIVVGAEVILMLALWDHKPVRDRKTGSFRPQGPRLFIFTPDGGIIEHGNCDAIGSGSGIKDQLLEFCDDVPREERNPMEAALFLHNLLSRVRRTDPHSGGEPLVQVVDASGVHEVMFSLRNHENAEDEKDETKDESLKSPQGGGREEES